MASQTKRDGVWFQVVYFGKNKGIVRRIERAAKADHRSVSEFIALAASERADRVLGQQARRDKHVVLKEAM